jgi:outer membrane biosynthesis protein TonB
MGVESHTSEVKEMSAKKAKKKSKQKDLYEVTVVDLREAKTEQIEQPKEVEQPEEPKQAEQLKQLKQPEQPEQPKQLKQETVFKLGAKVGLFRPNSGVDKLGRVLKIANQLLTVKWNDGKIEHFSRTGHSFYGSVNSLGEPIKPLGDNQKMWGTDEDPHLTLPTDHAK